MLRLTKRSEYGLMALAYLGSRAAEFCSVREMAEDMAVPARLLAEVLKDLARAELINSQRGPNGGYQFAKDPTHFTIFDIVEILEGEVQFTNCAPGLTCTRESSCTIHGAISKVAEQVKGVLDGFTLAHLTPGHPDHMMSAATAAKSLQV
ncbi:MAG: Rrf2 family transcriptional regulator [Planctomycetes bacterium]|jgi:Rrf2 family protein|nr:Rrf2 family transcriptional regulator [Planctomycetota bacterium]MBT4029533.1 Rrf2 family transcriptional regulator [Planctomycetota bacterium]MBT4560597.1 Rrf2 family transcriptional regulator [Planctomycetota bacterium]MBT5119169.1 Rrf2 family transcriptional regulator [Planctomycetota bacterium]MBT7013272.1 Rrf2 family transcriptional regulator [Planctomycetota bacterium]